MPRASFTTPDGREIAMTSLRDLRVLGEAIRPHARELAAVLQLYAANPQRKAGEVSMPSALVNMVVCLLLALPAPRRPGRRPKASTLEARRLLAELGSKHGAAKAVSRKTGEDIEVLRRRLRRKPGKPKRKRGT
jgi:hypothetical protein